MAAREKQILIRFFVKSASAAACIACWATNKHMKSKTNFLAAAAFLGALINGPGQPCIARQPTNQAEAAPGLK